MNKTSTIIIALVLAFSLQSANAGLLGTPLNLKATIEQADHDGSGSSAIFRYRSFQFFSGNDVLTGSVLISSC
jgi:hypothetical protein